MNRLALPSITATSPSLAETMRACRLRAGISRCAGSAAYVLGNPKAWLGTAYHEVLEKHAAEGASPPPEHVVVFDEAQRAWDEETGQKLLQRRRSEPELFLGILRRPPWACLVCLVGPGQEINRGEGGMALWGIALNREASAGRGWRVVAPSGRWIRVHYHPSSAVTMG
jgi:hypothetical protein